jgi:arylsulfatase A-like enzyme
MIDHLDRHVGEIIKTLEDLGVADNTIIFFAGDNGYSQWGYFNRKPWEDDPVFKNKGPWPYGKFIIRDGGMRIPYFVYWPGKIRPGSSDHITALYDFMATAGELAGEVKFESDGISIVPTLMGNPEKQQKHDFLYWENGSFGVSEHLYYNSHRQSLRMGDYFIYKEHPDSLIEVYDLVKDLQCLNNIANEVGDLGLRAKQYMKEAHADSEWYVNPGECEKEIHPKRIKAEREGTLQESIWPNEKY